MAEIGEFETTADLRAEAAELEAMAEEIHAQRDEFLRRCRAMEEKVGAAPFGTRAIASAVAALGESQTTDEAAEALTQVRAAVDEADAVGDITAAHEATGQVEAFAGA